MIDGLDEAQENLKRKLYDDIEYLSRRLTGSKIIMTCRTGEIKRNFSSFNTIQICPLTIDDVEVITQKWLGNDGSQHFLKELRKKTYLELATRPIFLFYLINLTIRNQSLPDLSCYIYQDIVDLAIKEWDKERDVSRYSKYAHFEPSRKRQFLARFAFELTYKIKTNTFTKTEFTEIYQMICDSFGLPKDEMAIVADEIESHTGIIIQSGYRSYEFTHLTIQEYLCADYISKSNTPHDTLISYLKSRPSPLAIAVALSHTPAILFSIFLMSEKMYNKANIAQINIFLNRINQETPQFEVDVYLGITMLYLCSQCKLSGDSDLIFNVKRLLENKVVAKSVANSLLMYCLDRNCWEDGICKLNKSRDINGNDYHIKAPDEIFIDRALFNAIIEKANISLDFLFDNYY